MAMTNPDEGPQTNINGSESSVNHATDNDLEHGLLDHNDQLAAGQHRVYKKRTKSGCLTCRKRRIKCDETRPVCQNCVKSKRQCYGYHQRVFFKPANIDFRQFQNGAAAITFPPGTLAMPMDAELLSRSHSNGYSHIRPRPAPEYAMSASYTRPFGTTAPAIDPSTTMLTDGAHEGMTPSMNNIQANRDWVHRAQTQPHEHQPDMFPTTMPPFVASPYANSLTPDQYSATQSGNTPLSVSANTEYAHQPPSMAHVPLPENMKHNQLPEKVTIVEGDSPMHSFDESDVARETRERVYLLSRSAGTRSIPAPFQLTSGGVNPDNLLHEAVTEAQDDDYYDVDSEDDEDINPQTALQDQRKLHQTLGLVMRLGRMTFEESALGIHVSSGAVDSYRAERVANPLRNTMTARVFAHFISITAPTFATFMRRPKPNRRRTQADGAIPFSEQGIWTVAMPMASLHHQALLQSILAVSSWHIARLTGASTTPSYKHYAYALKRIHASLGQPDKRHSVPTLAASLLLAIYELWSADHVKWNSHLAGAAQLLAEVDFKSGYRRFRRLKAEQSQRYLRRKANLGKGQSVPYFDDTLWDTISQVPEIDPQLVSILTGKVVNYDEFGHIEDLSRGNQEPDPSPPDIPKFETQKDLFWWFTKQDVVQCLVSGNPLIMSYERWTDCPPRGPPGDPMAVYATFDYMMLLLGRVADFSVRDRKRKLQKISLNGGRWRPAPGMQMGPGPPAQSPVPGQTTGPTPSMSGQSSPSPPQVPDFFGMAPPPPNTAMPSSYYTNASRPASVSPAWTTQVDFESMTNAAVGEWDQIRLAMGHFRSILGPAFDGRESNAIQTPFGPALIYRSYDISCFWSYFNLAMIALIRAHPDMPPHAQVACGVAAFQTREYANNIGRTAAGIVVPPEEESLSPGLMAAITEHSLPLFIAGVQYQNPQQRDWLLTRLFEVDRRCGFASAGIMAYGCQTSWIKAYEMGRGPPHTRRFDSSPTDERSSGSENMTERPKPPRREPPVPSMVDVTDRQYISVFNQTRLHYAVGLLGTEEDDKIQ